MRAMKEKKKKHSSRIRRQDNLNNQAQAELQKRERSPGKQGDVNRNYSWRKIAANQKDANQNHQTLRKTQSRQQWQQIEHRESKTRPN
jgi:hypothetical protein